jgi:hypothetical protein
MKSKLLFIILLFSTTIAFAQKSKLQQDRDAILSMLGCYKVSFNFAETFSPDTAYKIHKPHTSWGIELVSLVEDNPTKIVLQHLLIVDDSTIIKHWRQDWIYENTELLVYQKDNTWKKTILNKEQVKGQWTQKVYQVDDSPRYEATATWTHVDGKHKWESIADAPLPRREFTTRNDYNILNRRNTVYLTNTGWMFEQDNQKLVRSKEGDRLIAWEKGFESFTKLSSENCLAGTNWWNINKEYWNDVRLVWNEVFNKYDTIAIQKKVEDTLLWEKLFKLGSEKSTSKSYNSEESRLEIRRVIEKHLNG